HGAPSINFNQFLEKEKLKGNGSNFTGPVILEAELQKRFEHHDPCEMMRELKLIFETHAAVESYEASKQFFNCMMEEGSSVSEHMFAMSGHAKKLSDLGIVIPNKLGIHRVLQSLPPSYKNFVMNYNMQNMNKELPELFSMLKSAEVEIKKENQVLMVNKTITFLRSRASLTRATLRRGKGHWKRNCTKYLADLKSGHVKKKEKCVFIGYPKETIGYTFYHRSEGKIFVAKNGSFLEKEFLTKEVTGRKVELDEVDEPSLIDQSSAVPEEVPVQPAPIGEEANDDDHETSNEEATEPRRSTRERTTPDWYDPCLNVMIVDDNDEDPATYEEAMMSPDSNKWQEAMKSEMGSMYDNKMEPTNVKFYQLGNGGDLIFERDLDSLSEYLGRLHPEFHGVEVNDQHGGELQWVITADLRGKMEPPTSRGSSFPSGKAAGWTDSLVLFRKHLPVCADRTWCRYSRLALLTMQGVTPLEHPWRCRCTPSRGTMWTIWTTCCIRPRRELDNSRAYANQTHMALAQHADAIKLLAKDLKSLRLQRAKKDATIVRLHAKIASLEATVKAQEDQLREMEDDDGGIDLQGGGAFLSDDDDFEEEEFTEEEDYEFLEAAEDGIIPIDVDEDAEE
ncbi:hypothetical protein QYE76_004630, partial [Lolium multiflorum]